ncbi:MAG TPA: family 16 glycoside hydrolase [Solirubrobacter sp.]
MHRRVLAGCVALTALAAPAAAQAQYTAPPPAPGFHYIFDGTATGSDASFDKWKFASGTLAQSATQGQATLDAPEGTIRVGGSPFGSYWYTVRPFGNEVFRIQYQIENTPTSTPNGGIMIRAPYFAYTGATTNDVLAQKPTGFNYDVCGGALAFCNRTTPGASTTYNWAGAPGPFPPASNASTPAFEYTGGYCARQTAAGVYNVNGTNGQPLTVNGNANNHQHWTQVYCGHEVQINESLNGGGPNPSTDPIKTGSIYGFRNLNAQQSGTNNRLTKGVWHQYEIRTIGQQYTIMIDGKIINQFDNSIPKINTRAGDAPTMARQFTQGYLGLQTHGGTDRISYREIQVKDIADSDIPKNTAMPSITGSGYQGNALTCNHGTWDTPAGTTYFVKWYRSNKILPTNPRFRAPSATDYWNQTLPIDQTYGTQAQTITDSLLVGEGDTYTPTAEDVGKVVHCAVSADNAGATVWKTAVAPEILSATNANGDAGGTVPATLSLTLGTPASFGPFTPGVAKDYDAATTATVISSAADAALSIADASSTATGPLVNGTFSLPSALQAQATSAAGTGGALADVGGSAAPTGLLTYAGPVANDAVSVKFRQHISAADALRTGAYSKTLTFTLSTTTP